MSEAQGLRVKVLLLAGAMLLPLAAGAISAKDENRVAEREFLAGEIARLRSENADHEENRDYAKAEIASGKVLELVERLSGKRSLEYAAALDAHVSSLYWQRKYEEAEKFSAQAMGLRLNLAGTKDAATLDSMWVHADVLFDLGRSDEAIQLYQAALPIQRKLFGDNHDVTIHRFNWLAIQLDTVGRVADAVPLAAEIVNIRRKHLGDAHPATIQALYGQAYLFTRIDRHEDSDRLYQEGLRLRRIVSRDNPKELAEDIQAYIDILKRHDRFLVAEPYLAELVSLRRNTVGERDPEFISALNDHAKALLRLDRAAEAEPLLVETLRLRREVEGEDHPYTRETLNDLAEAYGHLERYADAEKLYAERLRLAREGNDWGLIGIIEDHARSLFGLDRFAEAEPLYTEALDRRLELGEAWKLDLGTVFRAQELALVQLLQPTRRAAALRAARFASAGARARYAAVLGSDIETEEMKNAEGGFLQMSNHLLLDATWFAASETPSEDGALRNEALLAIQEAGAGSTSRAIAQAAARRYTVSVNAADLLLDRGQLAAERMALVGELYKAHREIGEEPAARRERLEARLATVDDQRKAVETELFAKAPQYFAIINQPALTVAEAQAMLGEDEAVLIVVPSEFGTHVMALTRTGLVWQRAEITEDEVAQKVARLRQDLNPDEVAPGARGPDEGMARQTSAPAFDRATAHDLYTALIAPVAATLEGKTHLFIAADGALASLPFGVLVTEAPAEGSSDSDPAVLRSTPWFADSYALVQIPSLQSLAYLRTFNTGDGATSGSGPVRSTARTAAISFAGFGDPLLDGAAKTRGGRSAGSLPPVDAAKLRGTGVTEAGAPLMDPAQLRALSRLPGTRIELNAVGTLLGAPQGAIRLDSAMTEAALRSADLSTVRILHLATHGLTASEAGQRGGRTEPGLVFTPPEDATSADDGYLAASEVLTLDLTAVDWVILSACNTAAPSGKPGEAGLSGLARAFFYAGAPSLLVSHWPVGDDVAAELTVNTLRRTQAGESRATALQNAMRDIRNTPTNPTFAHPSAWAPFTIAGEGR